MGVFLCGIIALAIKKFPRVSHNSFFVDCSLPRISNTVKTPSLSTLATGV
jgi:hypothetical protein